MLLRKFLQWARAGRPAGRLFVLEQSLPGVPPSLGEQADTERLGLPDGWIHDAGEWSLLIESKVSAAPSHDQIERHLRTAARRGYPKARLLWLTVTPVTGKMPDRVENRTWWQLYAWLIRQQRRSEWARRAASYFEVAEVQADMKAQLKEGTLTRFTGIPFDEANPYSYSQAKRLLGLMRGELMVRQDLQRILGMNRKCPGRGAITGTSSSLVWDFISLRASNRDKVFTQHAHLTLGVAVDRIDACVTVPNGIRSNLRTTLLGQEYQDFFPVMAEVTQALDKVARRFPGCQPVVTVVQRRYASQRAQPSIDALLRFDPRTAIPLKPRAGERAVLVQPQWLIAAYDALKHRRANLQLQIGAALPYEKCPVTKRVEVIDVVAEVWKACTPIVRILHEAR